VAVEEHFGIKFQTAETEELKNVGHLIELIQQKLEAEKR
jgi:acyl carrier protein